MAYGFLEQHTDIAAYKFPGLKSEGYSPDHGRGGKTAIFFGRQNTPPSKNPVLRQKTLAPTLPQTLAPLFSPRIPMALAMEAFVHEEEEVDHPVRYLPLGHVYSAAPCINPSGSSNVMSKKVKARKLVEEGEEEGEGGEDEGRKKPLDLDRGSFQRSNAGKPMLVYHRRVKKPRPAADGKSPFDSLAQRLESRPDLARDWEGKEMERGDGDRLDLEADLVGEGKNVKKRNTMKYELLRLGDGSGSLSGVSGPRLRGTGGFNKTNVANTKKRVRDAPKDLSSLGKGKRWVELDFEGAVDPQTFVGLACKASESLWNIAGGD